MKLTKDFVQEVINISLAENATTGEIADRVILAEQAFAAVESALDGVDYHIGIIMQLRSHGKSAAEIRSIPDIAQYLDTLRDVIDNFGPSVEKLGSLPALHAALADSLHRLRNALAFINRLLDEEHPI